MIKHAPFSLAGIALSMTLAFSAQAAEALRIAADAVPCRTLKFLTM